MNKETIKRMLEAIDVRPLIAQLSTQGKVLVGVAVVLAIGVGLYLGYSPENILNWLGL